MGADASNCLRGRYLVFHLADRAYAVPVAAVEEIVPMAELAEVPGGPSFLAGFLNVGAKPIAVISLRRLFQLPVVERELFTPIVILKSARHPIALEVDAVKEIADIKDEDAVALGEGCVVNGFAVAAARLDGTTVLLLSPDRLLLEEERRRLAELADIARDRLAAVEAGTE
jgi:purine-binding chemotaxis protein CheW